MIAAFLGGSPGPCDDVLAWLLAWARRARSWAKGCGQWGDQWYSRADVDVWHEHCKRQHNIANPARILPR
eukprot:5808105-Karenia_brevis.AAC.1